MGTVDGEELVRQYTGGGAGETWPLPPQQIATTFVEEQQKT